MGLADNTCVPCRGGVPPLEPARVQELLTQLGRGWSLNQVGHLERLYTFKDFVQGRTLDPQDQRADGERFLHGGQGRPGLRSVSRSVIPLSGWPPAAKSHQNPCADDHSWL
jgi:hypothetical protein